MSAAALIVIFGMTCAKPCSPAVEQERAKLEREVVRVLSERGFAVRPAPESARRPTGQTASPEVQDEAGLLDAERLVVLDLEADERLLWITHFMRGVPGAWSIGRAVCARENGVLVCPELASVVLGGLRPRRATDVDLRAALRFQAKVVGRCINEQDRLAIDDRIFGRVEMDLLVDPNGSVKIEAIAPALVSKAPLGRCLRAAMEAINVGPFEGEAIRFRIPIDLD